MKKNNSLFVLRGFDFIIGILFFLYAPLPGTCQKENQNNHDTGNTNLLSDFKTAPALKWKFHTNQPLLSSPIINGNTVYLGGLDSILYSIGINTGKINWKFRTSGEIRSDVLINDNQLYLVGGDNKYQWNSLLFNTYIMFNNDGVNKIKNYKS